MFCLVHGSFVFALFGSGSEVGSGLFAPLQSIPAMLTRDHLATAAIALILLQLVDWVRDIREHGLGSDNIRELMTRPYRRIVVLHLTILGSGFLLMAMDEPLAGLVMLVLMKTGFDVYHWRKDEAPEEQKDGDTDLLSPEMLRQMEEKLPEPMVKVNGKEIRYESFQAMRDSKHFRMLAGVLRLMGKGRELRAMNAYLDRRIAEESAP
jgi:hypothetical protein